VEDRDQRPSDAEESPGPQDVAGDGGQPETGETARPAVAVAPPWTSGGAAGRSSGRWASIGCGAVVVALVALLFVGVSLTKRTAWMAFARGRQRLVEVVAREHPTARLRTARNLNRFASRLRASRDPYRALGEFLAREREALADGRLDAGELEDLNRFLEGAAPLSGVGSPP
jgi:hypothetical protein